jgi:RecA-family ATPase
MTVVCIQTAADPAPPVIDLLAWVAEEVPDRSWLVPGLVPYGCVTSLYGDGGSGKTLLALWLMVCMASRHVRHWLGEAVAGWKSVGLFSEDDEHEIVRRIQQICAAEDLSFAAVAPMISAMPGVGIDTVIAGFGDSGELRITPLLHALIDRVKADGAHLLIIDYAASVFGGNEIDRWQVSEFMRRLNAIARDNDIAILLLGHPSQSGMTGGRGTSGSTAWRNQSRSFLHLTVDDAQDDPDGRRLLTLTHSKSNYSRAGRTFRIASDGAQFEVLDTHEGPVVKSRRQRLSRAQKVALSALREAIAEAGGPSPGGSIPMGVRCVKIQIWRQYAYSAGISDADTTEARRKAFQTARTALLTKGFIGTYESVAWTLEAGV